MIHGLKNSISRNKFLLFDIFSSPLPTNAGADSNGRPAFRSLSLRRGGLGGEVIKLFLGLTPNPSPKERGTKCA
jgi:hypothetical protein